MDKWKSIIVLMFLNFLIFFSSGANIPISGRDMNITNRKARWAWTYPECRCMNWRNCGGRVDRWRRCSFFGIYDVCCIDYDYESYEDVYPTYVPNSDIWGIFSFFFY